MSATSRAESRAFTLTIHARNVVTANAIIAIAGEFSPTTITRSPGRTPRAASLSAHAWRAWSRSRQVCSIVPSVSARRAALSAAQRAGISPTHRGATLRLPGEAGGEAQVSGGRERQEARAHLLRQRQGAQEGVQVIARDAALAARELLQLFVRAGNAMGAHHGLHRFGEHVPGLVEVGGDAGRVGFELLEAAQAGVVGDEAVAEGHAHVAQHGGIGEVALPAGYRQLLGEVAQQRVGEAEVAFRILEVDRVHLVWHGGRADLARLHLLLEVAERDVAPDVAVEVEQDGVEARRGIERFGERVVRLDLDGERVVAHAEPGHD